MTWNKWAELAEMFDLSDEELAAIAPIVKAMESASVKKHLAKKKAEEERNNAERN